MAKYAPVAPLHMLEQLESAGVLGDYHLLLAHDVVKEPKRYEALFKDKGMYIIMDNSLIELGKPVGAEVMKDACEIVGASVAVLPDTLGNSVETVTMTHAALEEWPKHGIDRFMAVAQGTSLFELVIMVGKINEHPNASGLIKTWAVPKVLQEKYLGSRMDAIRTVLRASGKPIHLLGMSNSLSDDIACCRAFPGTVQGIDSAVPVRYGCANLVIDSIDVRIDRPRGDFMEAGGDQGITDTACLNIKWVRDAVAAVAPREQA